jgi:hypothetical protein
MRQQLGKYLFEIVVIFIGITLSFIFDEWRESRNENSQRKILFESIKTELQQTKILLQKSDTTNTEHIANIKRILKGENLEPEEILEDFELLTTDFYVNLSGALNTLQSLTGQNSTSFYHNAVITQNISNINSIAEDHSHLVLELKNISSEKIYPLLSRYSILDDLVLFKADSISLNGNYSGLLADKNFYDHLKVICIKLTSLSIIYETLIRDLDRILIEIEKELHQ